MINLLGIIPTREYIKTAHTSRLVQSNDAFDVHNTQTVIFSAFNRFLLTEQYIKRCLQMCIWYMDCRFINLYMPFVTPILLWIWCANLLLKHHCWTFFVTFVQCMRLEFFPLIFYNLYDNTAEKMGFCFRSMLYTLYDRLILFMILLKLECLNIHVQCL